MPLAPSRRRASRAMSVAMLTLFRLAERHLLRRHRAGVLEAAEVQRHELRLHDLGQHVRQPHLLNLDPPIGLSNMTRFFGVAERLLVAGHRRADRAPRDAVARLREAHERALDAARSWAGSRPSGSCTSWKTSSLVSRRAERELALLILRREALRVGRHDEAADGLRSSIVAGLRPHDRDRGLGAVGDPHLGAVQHPAVRRLSRAIVIMPAGFEPKSGSVRPKQPISCRRPAGAASAASAPRCRTRRSDTSPARPAPTRTSGCRSRRARAPA